MNFKTTLVTLFFITVGLSASAAIPKTYMLSSPDHKLEIKITINDSVQYALYYKTLAVISPSAVSMTLENQVLGLGSVVHKVKENAVRSVLHPLYGKSSQLSDNYNELKIDFEDNYALVFRAYNDGMSYRFITALKGEVTVIAEKASFNLTGNPGVIFSETDNYTSWEVPYLKYNAISDIVNGKKAITPTLFFNPLNNVKVVVAESDLFDYPGMYLQKQQAAITGTWANYPSRVELGSWGNFVSVVKEREKFIAKTTGKRIYPWRVIMVTDQDADLLNNQLVYKLASPSRLGNTSWIKPGKATWEWWHDALLPGAPVASGMDNRNTALYDYYIDFAAANHLEYLMIDAGWCDNYDVRKVKPHVDIREIIQRGKSKQVGVFVWCVATTLLKDLDGQLDFLQSIGAAGIKVDFFDRDDQLAIAWFEKIAKAAAKRKLMIDFHGCSKPTGLQKTYPNIVNYEAVRGAECSKWDYTANPDQHLLIPFIRMLAGPLDYTPGSMRNKTKAAFKPVDPGLPSTQGTRCHELAMYVIYDQPFGMLCDSPTEYMKYPDLMRFLSAVPTVFEETRVLDAKLGEYAVMAKKKNDQWFVGAMTNWESRKLQLDFSFLPAGKTYTAEVFMDASDADTHAENYTRLTIQVNKDSRLSLPLAKGGGATAWLH